MMLRVIAQWSKLLPLPRFIPACWQLSNHKGLSNTSRWKRARRWSRTHCVGTPWGGLFLLKKSALPDACRRTIEDLSLFDSTCVTVMKHCCSRSDAAFPNPAVNFRWHPAQTEVMGSLSFNRISQAESGVRWFQKDDRSLTSCYLLRGRSQIQCRDWSSFSCVRLKYNERERESSFSVSLHINIVSSAWMGIFWGGSPVFDSAVFNLTWWPSEKYCVVWSLVGSNKKKPVHSLINSGLGLNGVGDGVFSAV